MCRPPPFFVHQIVLGSVVILAAGGCGKGLYTHVARVSDGSGGGVIDPESGTGGTGAGGTGSTSPDTGGSIAGTSGTSSVDPSRSDAGSGPSDTKSGNYDSELKLTVTIPNGEASLFIPKGTLPKGGDTQVTLSLVSSDGSMPNYDGAIGPIYSISVKAAGAFQSDSAVLSIRVPSDLGLSSQKIALAYLDKDSGGWIAIQTPQPTYEAAGIAKGTVVWFPEIRFFAPFETCTKAGQDGGSCRPTPNRASWRCWGEACQL